MTSPLPPHKVVHVHKLIRATAIEMAGALYDDVMHDNRLYAEWKRVCPELSTTLCEAMFIELLWPKLIAKARATLASMLGPGNANVSPAMKEEIYAALIADNSLVVGRGRRERRAEASQLRKQLKYHRGTETVQ